MFVDKALAAKAPGPMRAFFVPIRVKRDHPVAAVALARKPTVLCWHLLTREEGWLRASPALVAKKARDMELQAVDLDATMATTGRNRRLEPRYRRHGVVNALAGSSSRSRSRRPRRRRDDRTIEADASCAYAEFHLALRSAELRRSSRKAGPSAAPCPRAASAMAPGATLRGVRGAGD